MTRNRGYRIWTRSEELALQKGVQAHGVGAWEIIRQDPVFACLCDRTGVQLKDKWRNLVKFKHLPRSLVATLATKPKSSWRSQRVRRSKAQSSAQNVVDRSTRLEADEEQDGADIQEYDHNDIRRRQPQRASSKFGAAARDGNASDDSSDVAYGHHAPPKPRRRRRASPQDKRFGIYDMRRYTLSEQQQQAALARHHAGDGDEGYHHMFGNVGGMMSMPDGVAEGAGFNLQRGKDDLEVEAMGVDDEFEDAVVDCPCGVTYDDGQMMIECEACQAWAHVHCLKAQQASLPSQLKYDFEQYTCLCCQGLYRSVKEEEGQQVSDPWAEEDDHLVGVLEGPAPHQVGAVGGGAVVGSPLHDTQCGYWAGLDDEDDEREAARRHEQQQRGMCHDLPDGLPQQQVISTSCGHSSWGGALGSGSPRHMYLAASGSGSPPAMYRHTHRQLHTASSAVTVPFAEVEQDEGALMAEDALALLATTSATASAAPHLGLAVNASPPGTPLPPPSQLDDLLLIADVGEDDDDDNQQLPSIQQREAVATAGSPIGEGVVHGSSLAAHALAAAALAAGLSLRQEDHQVGISAPATMSLLPSAPLMHQQQQRTTGELLSDALEQVMNELQPGGALAAGTANGPPWNELQPGGAVAAGAANNAPPPCFPAPSLQLSQCSQMASAATCVHLPGGTGGSGGISSPGSSVHGPPASCLLLPLHQPAYKNEPCRDHQLPHHHHATYGGEPPCRRDAHQQQQQQRQLEDAAADAAAAHCGVAFETAAAAAAAAAATPGAAVRYVVVHPPAAAAGPMTLSGSPTVAAAGSRTGPLPPGLLGSGGSMESIQSVGAGFGIVSPPLAGEDGFGPPTDPSPLAGEDEDFASPTTHQDWWAKLDPSEQQLQGGHVGSACMVPRGCSTPFDTGLEDNFLNLEQML